MVLSFKKPICIFVVIAISCLVVCRFYAKDRIYETDSVHDYGRYIGNYDNDTPSEFITSFFPTKIENSFSFVEYHYKAKKLDTYSYEAYLEFCINDPVQFFEYVDNNVSVLTKSKVFSYDNSFKEYNLSNVYSIASNKEITGEDSYRILSAQVGKILVSNAEQRIIYVAIGHHDGGGTDTSELCYFFDKFSIDPIDYADSAFDTFFEEQQSSHFS